MTIGDQNRITYFGITDTRGKRVPFGIKQDDRSKHTYVIGKSGMGKSTLLENMAVQDIQNGEGICFIDPHGGTAEKLMEYIPEHRVKDVLYFAPFDLQYPVSFNVLENVDGDKRHLVVAGLMSAFEKIWVDAWSARMAYILQNTLAALLEFPGATLLGVNRMYIDKDYRKNVIAQVTDPSVRSFWVDEFAKYTDRYAQEATPAIQNKIGQFASNALVRNVIGQETSSFNMRELMDQRKIFIVNLSKGRVGEGNANLLGSMLITKMYLAAMSRADVSLGGQRALPPFYLFVDEFQNFANKSFAEILSEARKYKLALTIAHQYIEQMEEEVRAAVFGNVGTMITFRVGAYDADVLEKEFAPTFEIDDLVNLGARQVYLKLMIDSVSSQPFSATTMPPIPEPEVNQTDRAIAFSRARYSRPRAEVEKVIKDWSERKYEDPEAEGKERARDERRMVRDAEGERSPRESAPVGAGPSRAPFQPAHDRAGGDSRPPRRDVSSRSDGPPPHRETRVERPAPEGQGAYRGREQQGGQVRREGPSTEQQGGSHWRENSTPPRRDDRTSLPPQRPPVQRSLPPRSVPLRKEGTKDELRSILAKLAKPIGVNEELGIKNKGSVDGVGDMQCAVSDVRSTPAPSANAERSPFRETSPQPTTHNSQSHAGARDDGKGVTDEGKAQLRNLLASLSKPPSVSVAESPKNTSGNTSTNTSIPVVPPSAVTGAHNTASTPSREVSISAPLPPVPVATERATSTPREVSTSIPPQVATVVGAIREQQKPKGLLPEELKKMLHVDKPML
ncbi:MAG: type IV secretion system DNA-binding domain-containing protein [Candidatus Pacebacteria bacterium]|nr:type IV secretion system DNA-binding domain-containing protein [Candidatus Paceibacterota bacterium]